MALIVDIADAVVTGINGASILPVGVVATRVLRPSFEIKDLADLHVSVVPTGDTRSMESRDAEQRDLQIDIGVQQKIATPTTEEAEVTALIGLVDLIADTLRQIGQFEEAVWIGSEVDLIYSPEHLENQSVFVSVLSITLRVMVP